MQLHLMHKRKKMRERVGFAASKGGGCAGQRVCEGGAGGAGHAALTYLYPLEHALHDL